MAHNVVAVGSKMMVDEVKLEGGSHNDQLHYAKALRLFEENSRNFAAGFSESEVENQNSEDSQNPSTADSAATIKQEPEATSQDGHVLDNARANLDMSSLFPVEDTDALSELESELSEFSESELFRRFAEIDAADTQSQSSDLSDLSDNGLLWRFERIDAAAIEDELAGMELLRIDNEVVHDTTSAAAPAADTHQEATDTSRDGLAISAFQEHPRHLADPDEFLPTADNLDNLHYPLELDEDTLPPEPLDLTICYLDSFLLTLSTLFRIICHLISFEKIIHKIITLYHLEFCLLTLSKLCAIICHPVNLEKIIIHRIITLYHLVSFKKIFLREIIILFNVKLFLLTLSTLFTIIYHLIRFEKIIIHKIIRLYRLEFVLSTLSNLFKTNYHLVSFKKIFLREIIIPCNLKFFPLTLSTLFTIINHLVSFEKIIIDKIITLFILKLCPLTLSTRFTIIKHLASFEKIILHDIIILDHVENFLLKH
ncbi:hypothetical protein LTS06_008913 [Exophiala xenobiotica]|nr:hypothetical protein LTS06_008913 [Exophiala xenobiotica]